MKLNIFLNKGEKITFKMELITLDIRFLNFLIFSKDLNKTLNILIAKDR